MLTFVLNRVLGSVLQSVVYLYASEGATGKKFEYCASVRVKSMPPDVRTERKLLALNESTKRIHVSGIQNIPAVLTQGEMFRKLEDYAVQMCPFRQSMWRLLVGCSW